MKQSQKPAFLFSLKFELIAIRTRLQPIRTAAEIQATIVFEPTEIQLYQKLASKIEELYLLGMSFRAISRDLKVNRKTVIRALKFKGKLKK